MNIEITGPEEARLISLMKQKRKIRENLNAAMEVDNGQASEHWSKEMRLINEQVGTLLMRCVDEAEYD
jgi:hypothetical protein